MIALHRYARTQNETASRERTMVLLFEAALRHTRTGIVALDSKQPAEAVQSLTKASDIVAELDATLDHGRAPELAKNLAGVYAFVATRLTLAAARKDAVLAREAERVFAPVVDAFSTAVASLGKR